MNDLLRIALDTVLFFVSTTAIFLLGVIVDGVAQTRGAARPSPQAAFRGDRTGSREDEVMEPPPAVTA